MAPGANISQPAALKGDSQSHNESSSHYSSGASTQKSEKTSPDVRRSDSAVKEHCKERLTTYRKNVLKNMILSDQLDMRDPQCIAEYAQDIYSSMTSVEADY